MSYFTRLECTYCGTEHDASAVQTVCKKCGKPLFARYDIEGIKESVTRRELVGREASMWRYWELLPVRYRKNVVTLGEGWTP